MNLPYNGARPVYDVSATDVPPFPWLVFAVTVPIFLYGVWVWKRMHRHNVPRRWTRLQAVTLTIGGIAVFGGTLLSHRAQMLEYTAQQHWRQNTVFSRVEGIIHIARENDDSDFRSEVMTFSVNGMSFPYGPGTVNHNVTRTMLESIVADSSTVQVFFSGQVILRIQRGTNPRQ